MKFPATIIFLTVAGEGQGLNGSHHFAWMADQKRDEWQIEAVLNNDIVGGDKNPQQDPRTVRVFSEAIPSDMLNPMRGPASLETGSVCRKEPEGIALAWRGERLILTPIGPLHRGSRAGIFNRFVSASSIPARPLPARRRSHIFQPIRLRSGQVY